MANKKAIINLLPGGSMYDNPYLDPEKIFRSKYDKVLKHSQGIERFALQIIPEALLRSLIKLDPTYVFKMSPHRVAEANRLRKRTRKNSLDVRQLVSYQRYDYRTSTGNWAPGFYWSPPVHTSSPSTTTSSLTKSGDHVEESNDTVTKTRKLWEKGGEFHTWNCDIYSPARNLSYRNDFIYRISHPDGSVGYGDVDRIFKRYVGPAGARVTASTLSTLKASKIALLPALAAEHGPRLLKEVLPEGRNYSLFRNVAELRDLPRSVRALRTALGDLQQLEKALSGKIDLAALRKLGSDALSHLPAEYVSYWFGWHTLYRDAVKLLDVPEKITKQTNRLVERSGKDSSFRTEVKWSERADVTSPFLYESVVGYGGVTLTATEAKEITIRAMVSANYDLPPLDVPDFQRNLFFKKLGVYPTISDVYELIPWSWLVDWFTGLGNYLELVEAINTDPALFNYGYLTVDVKGEIQSTHTCTGTDRKRIKISPGYDVTYTWPQKVTHTSTLVYRARSRFDISVIADAATTSDVDSLSLYQKSILGALIAMRA